MSLYDELRQKHSRLIYHSYEFRRSQDCTRLEFHFSIDDYHFRPAWTFPAEYYTPCCDRELADKIAFSLGMAELVSYWKCACPPVVEVRCGGLSTWEKNWWKKLYFNGLGEFFYRNGITPDFDSFMTIEARSEQPLSHRRNDLSGFMVPVGGGKDSVVTLELLKKTGEDISAYIINPRPATLGCADAAGIPPERIIAPKRTIDKLLLELNKQGYLNGHTPFSAVVAFSAELFACMNGLKYIALSNESSANEAYVEGTSINHQYSKSTEFERDFREYCERGFGGYERCPEYFSLLRPWSEWQIAREFVKYPQYFGVFQSCNLGSKNNTWCCNCAKCLYVYILLAAFLDDDVLVGIFGCNMLEKEELSAMFYGLILDGEDKPFECVGTKDEVRLSLEMACQRRKSDPPALLRRWRELFPKYAPVSLDKFFDTDNFVPESLKYLLGENHEH